MPRHDDNEGKGNGGGGDGGGNVSLTIKRSFRLGRRAAVTGERGSDRWRSFHLLSYHSIPLGERGRGRASRAIFAAPSVPAATIVATPALSRHCVALSSWLH